MKNNDSKLNTWVIIGAVLCCGIPLLLLVSGGSILALIGGFITGSNLFFALAIIFVFIFIWLIFKRKKL